MIRWLARKLLPLLLPEIHKIIRQFLEHWLETEIYHAVTAQTNKAIAHYIRTRGYPAKETRP